MKRAESRRWREWGPTYFASIATIAGVIFAVYASGYGLARILRASNVLDASVNRLTSTQETASGRLEQQTRSLITWTKLLFAVSAVLCVVTVVLVVAAVWPRR